MRNKRKRARICRWLWLLATIVGAVCAWQGGSLIVGNLLGGERLWQTLAVLYAAGLLAAFADWLADLEGKAETLPGIGLAPGANEKQNLKGGEMMGKPKALYRVQNSSGRTLHIWAASSNQAKRAFCREYGISPSDYWCGLPDLTARRLKPEEVKAWEEQAKPDRDALMFIQGMLEISAKAYAEREQAL